jgi:3-methyladenine DNA glycosylase AlkD
MRKPSAPSGTTDVASILATLERKGSKRNRDGMARYAIVAPKAFGVSVGELRAMGKRIGKDHDLAAGLWRTGWYEARMLAAFVDDPALVTSAQMDRWAKDFDNWAVCDHCCFHLFDRTPHAWRKVDQWADRRDEFVKRAAFALLASLGVHDKRAADDQFLRCLPLVERAATDERNFVKKGVSWALRVAGRRSPALNVAAVKLAARLKESPEPAARWVGSDAYRELTGALVQRKLTKQKAAGR